MTLLNRYIAGNLVKGWLIVALVLAAVFTLIAFIQELERTRHGYDIAEVARYVSMTMPQNLLSLAPVIALLGTIMALANMDKFNELTIVSCSGVPFRKLLAAITFPSLLLMLLLWLCMEYVAAPLHQAAEQRRHETRNFNSVVLPDGGVWSRHGTRYMHIGRMLEDDSPGRIRLFEFDEDGKLLRAIYAKSATVGNDRTWRFNKARQKTFTGKKLQTRMVREMEVKGLWSRDELPTVTLSSDDMSLSVLYRYGQYLAEDGQPSEKYQMAFWQKVTMPLTAAAMILLATPISASIGSRRERNFGVNMAIGAVIGIGFYLAAQIIYSLGQLLGFNLLTVCLLPTGLVIACALLLLRRMRW